jgi:predicted transcriptional regulator
MPDETPSASVNRELISTIVAAYVGRSQIASDQLAALISTVQEAITSLGKPAQESEGEGTPAAPTPVRKGRSRSRATSPKQTPSPTAKS